MFKPQNYIFFFSQRLVDIVFLEQRLYFPQYLYRNRINKLYLYVMYITIIDIEILYTIYYSILFRTIMLLLFICRNVVYKSSTVPPPRSETKRLSLIFESGRKSQRHIRRTVEFRGHAVEDNVYCD